MRIVLVPGAGGVAHFWHRLIPLLAEAGHDPHAVDLPGDDPTADLQRYTDLVIAATPPGSLLVAQSLGGFTAAMVAERVPLAQLVFVNAMIPLPGETPGTWGEHVGSAQAREEAALARGYSTEFDEETYFLHDVSADMLPEERDEDAIVFASPCAFTAWPSIPIRVIAGADDRLFPVSLQRRVARERLGVNVTVIPGGHLNALSQPHALARAILDGI